MTTTDSLARRAARRHERDEIEAARRAAHLRRDVERTEGMAAPAVVRALVLLASSMGWTDREARLAMAGRVLGRPVASYLDLTATEARMLGLALRARRCAP